MVALIVRGMLRAQRLGGKELSRSKGPEFACLRAHETWKGGASVAPPFPCGVSLSDTGQLCYIRDGSPRHLAVSTPQQRIMRERIYRALGALALLGIWMAIPVGRMLGTSNALAWFLTALGVLAGTSAGWLAQYLLRRPMTRQMLTGPGWAAGALVFAGLFTETITGPGAVRHVAMMVAYSGLLAWGARLLVAPARDELEASKDSRNLLVDIRLISHAGEEVAPRPVGQRTTPVSQLLHPRPTLEHTSTPKSKDQKAG